MFKVYWGYARVVVLAVILAFAITAVFTPARVSGTSMEPTINSGDLVVLNKMAYVFDKPEVGDLVVFTSHVHTGTDGGGLLIKRVAEVTDDCVFVLGDNSAASLDSRDPAIGLVDTNDIIGKVQFRVLPMSKIGTVH